MMVKATADKIVYISISHLLHGTPLTLTLDISFIQFPAFNFDIESQAHIAGKWNKYIYMWDGLMNTWYLEICN